MADREVTLKLNVELPAGPAKAALAQLGEEATKAGAKFDAMKKGLAGAVSPGGGSPQQTVPTAAGRAADEPRPAELDQDYSPATQRRFKAEEAVKGSLEHQKQIIAGIVAQMKPEVLRERVTLTMREMEERKRLSEAFEQERIAQGGLTQLQEQVTAALAAEGKGRQFNLELEKERAKLYGGEQEMRRADAVDKIGQSLKSQRQTLEDIKAAMDPAVLQERVKLTIEEQKQREKLDKAFNKELKKQHGGKELAREIGGFVAGETGANAVKAFQDGGAGEALKSLTTAALTAGAGLLAFKSVALASPGAVERFKLVLEDTAAVVGQTLTPVLEVVTQVVKLFGDILATLLPSADDMREVLAPIVEFLHDLREALAPLISVIHDVLIVALKALAAVLNIVLYPFKILAKMIAALFGTEDKKLKDSTGTAARTISFQNQESYAKSVYAAAYKTGGMGETKPEKDTPAWLEAILNVLRDIGSFIRTIISLMPGGAQKIANKEMFEGLQPIFEKKIAEGTHKAMQGPQELEEAVAGWRKLAKAAGDDPDKAEKWMRQKVKEAQDSKAAGGGKDNVDAELLDVLRKIASNPFGGGKEGEDWIADRQKKGINRGMDGFGGNF